MGVLQLKEIKLSDAKKFVAELVSDKELKAQRRVLIVGGSSEDSNSLFARLSSSISKKEKGVRFKESTREIHINGMHLIRVVCESKGREWTDSNRSSVKSIEFKEGLVLI